MKRTTRMILLLLFLMLLFLFAGYFFLAYYYRGSFSLNTWINGVYCTGKTVEEVNAELLSDAEAPIVTITDREEKSYTLNLEETGFEKDYEGPLNRYLEEQNPYLWVENILLNKKHALAPAVTVQEDRLRQLWEELPFVKEEKQRETVFEIRFGEEGYFLYDGLENRLDTDAAYEALCQSITNGKNQLFLTEADCYYTVEKTEEQEKLAAFWEKIAAFQSLGLVYDMGDTKIPLAGKTAAAFLAMENGLPLLDKDGNLRISEEAVREFIKALAEEYDTYGVERDFESTRGDIVTIKGGTYGTKMNQKAEVKYLLERLAEEAERCSRERGENFSAASEVHVPEYEKEGLYRGKNDIGPTYIEIDMTEQKMYYYEEGELLLETEVVTGNTSRRWGTPEGVNYVYNKQRNRVLRGPGYASPVKYWMPVKGAIGIHDANWRSKFGGEIYQKNGSHGCINTPTEVMTELYDMVEIGTPVVMFY